MNMQKMVEAYHDEDNIPQPDVYNQLSEFDTSNVAFIGAVEDK